MIKLLKLYFYSINQFPCMLKLHKKLKNSFFCFYHIVLLKHALFCCASYSLYTQQKYLEQNQEFKSKANNKINTLNSLEIR